MHAKGHAREGWWNLLVFHAEDEEEAGASLPEPAPAEAAESVAEGDERTQELAAPGDQTAASHANGHPKASGETCAHTHVTACWKSSQDFMARCSHLMALCFCPSLVRTTLQRCH